MAMLVSVFALLITSLVQRAVGDDSVITLPFGDQAGDAIGPYGNNAISPPITLRMRFPFYGRKETTLYISENGILSFGRPVNKPFGNSLPYSTDANFSIPAFIAAYWGDMNTIKNGGAIFYRHMDSSDRRFCNQNLYVLQLIREGFGGLVSGFDPTYLFIVSWDAVYGFQTGNNAVTFQVILATDSNVSFVLLLYSDVRWNISNGHRALVGFNAGDGERSFTHPLSVADKLLDLDRETNGRRMGLFVYRVDQNEIVEPSPESRSEVICNLSCDTENVRTCHCPTNMELHGNGVNCKFPPVAVELVNNTPSMMEGGVMAMLKTNRPDAVIHCQLLRQDKHKYNCSSGVFQRRGLRPNTYILRVVARVPGTSEKCVLRRMFRVADKGVCLVTLVNKGVAVNGTQAEVEFEGNDLVQSFLCRMDRQQAVECKSPFVISNLSRGRHRIVIIPSGCGRKRKPTSQRFEVN